MADTGDDAEEIISPEFAEGLAEVERMGITAFGDLMERRKELAALAMAAARGDLIDRPLAATEREIVRDALCLCYAMSAMGNVRDALLRGAK